MLKREVSLDWSPKRVVALVCSKCGRSMVIQVDGDQKTAFHNCYKCGTRLIFDAETGEVLKQAD